MHFDVFNGDADGICSLIQLRLSDPQPNAILVTGPKRDIELVGRVSAEEGDIVTVCDISLARNRAEVERVLNEGAAVHYFDHHEPGEPIDHANLTTRIVLKGEMCTAAIVDRHLDGAHREWAVVGAFGDNMNAMAERLAEGQGFDLTTLKEFGNLLNYNGYGASLDDLHYHPDALFKMLVEYESPSSFLREDSDVVPTLRDGFESDLSAADAGEVLLDTPTHFAVRLADSDSARRISGLHGNRLASRYPDRAHAVLTDRGGVSGVSIRAPISSRRGALGLAKRFGGGGREAAAGIDSLADNDIPRFLDAFSKSFV